MLHFTNLTSKKYEGSIKVGGRNEEPQAAVVVVVEIMLLKEEKAKS